MTDGQGLIAIRDEWDALFTASRHTNPFARWGWMYHWWESFGRTRRPVPDRLNVVVYRDGRGVVRSIIPLFGSYRGVYKFRPFLNLKTISVVPEGSIMEIPPLLISPGWEEVVARSLGATLRYGSMRYHWADIWGIPVDQTLGAWWRGIPDPKEFQILKSYYLLPLPDTWEELRQTLSRNTRQSIRHSYNALLGHDVRLETVERLADLLPALEEFFDLHAKRADMQDTVHHPDRFDKPAYRQLLRDVAGDPANGGFRIARLRVDGVVVASRVLLQASDHLYFYYSGFDPAWGEYGVMNRLTTECIQMAIADPRIKTVNLSVGFERTKTRWNPEERLIGGFRVPSQARREAAMYKVARLAACLRSQPL